MKRFSCAVKYERIISDFQIELLQVAQTNPSTDQTILCEPFVLCYGIISYNYHQSSLIQ